MTRVRSLVQLIVSALSLSLLLAVPAAQAVPVTEPVAGPVAGPGAPASSPPPAKDEPQTELTFLVPGCEGCRIGLVSAVWPQDGTVEPDVWNGPTARVRDGEVVFTVPTSRTRGLSATVVAPWERRLGYVTQVVWAYRGEPVGERMTLRQARTERRASTCWAGTADPEVTVPLVVREVRVRGIGGRTDGTIAFARDTLDTMPPRYRTWRGVAGTQDVSICGVKADR